MKQLVFVRGITIAFLLAAFTMVNHTKAQNLMAGIKGGMNYSSVSLDYFDTYDFRLGNNLGIFAQFQSSSLPFKIAAEVQYSKIGANNIDPTLVYYRESPLLDMPIQKSHFIFNSIEAPLMLKFELPLLNDLNPHAYIGGAYNYIFSAYNRNEFEENQINDAEITQRIKANDYSALVGLGGSINMEQFAITYDLRYRMGLNTINNVVGYPQFNAHSWQAMIGVGYYIMENSN
jgi:hypothetical protein